MMCALHKQNCIIHYYGVYVMCHTHTVNIEHSTHKLCVVIVHISVIWKKKIKEKNYKVAYATSSSQWRFSDSIYDLFRKSKSATMPYSLWRPHLPVRTLKGSKVTSSENALPIICSLTLAKLYTGLRERKKLTFFSGGISLWVPSGRKGQKAWI